MSTSRLKGAILRAVDQWLDSGTHLVTRDPYDTAPLSPLLEVLRRLRRTSSPDASPLTIRRRFEADMASFRYGFEAGSIQDLALPISPEPLKARLYRPRAVAAGSMLTVYFHGGGFVMGDLDTHDDACRLLCESSGMPLLAVAYRLAPEARFPAAVDDAVASARWALEHMAELGVSSVAVAGDSAGANLAAVTAASLAEEGHHLAAQLLIYPGTDLSRSWPSHETLGSGYFLDTVDRRIFYQAYLQDVSGLATDPRVSPLLGRVATGIAPALVVTAGYDMLKDEGHAYALHLRQAGVPAQTLHFPRLGHAFINLSSVHRESRSALDEVARQWRTWTTEHTTRASA